MTLEHDKRFCPVCHQPVKPWRYKDVMQFDNRRDVYLKFRKWWCDNCGAIWKQNWSDKIMAYERKVTILAYP